MSSGVKKNLALGDAGALIGDGAGGGQYMQARAGDDRSVIHINTLIVFI